MDRALEKPYNKPAKSPEGVLLSTQKKESAAKWNLIKHENLCEYNNQNEYSTHH